MPASGSLVITQHPVHPLRPQRELGVCRHPQPTPASPGMGPQAQRRSLDPETPGHCPGWDNSPQGVALTPASPTPGPSLPLGEREPHWPPVPAGLLLHFDPWA